MLVVIEEEYIVATGREEKIRGFLDVTGKDWALTPLSRKYEVHDTSVFSADDLIVVKDETTEPPLLTEASFWKSAKETRSSEQELRREW